MKNRMGSSTRGFLVGAVVAAAAIVAVVVVQQMDPRGRKGPGLSKAYTYDLTELRKVDPRIILYDLAATIGTPFQDARGIAVGSDGRICLAADGGLHVLGPEAVKQGYDAGRARRIRTAQTPRCLAVDADGTLYAGVGNHVEVYQPTGEPKAAWAPPADDALLTSIALGPEDVFVADASNRVVLRYDRSGKLLGRIGRKDPARHVPGFIVPSAYFDLAMAPDGLLRVVSPGRLRIEAYTPGGDLAAHWGRPSPHVWGFTGCCNPVNFAIAPGGDIVTCEKGLRRVKLYDASGRFKGVVAPPDALATHPPAGRKVGELDVAVDRGGRVFVLDPYTGEVKVFVRKAPASRPTTGEHDD